MTQKCSFVLNFPSSKLFAAEFGLFFFSLDPNESVFHSRSAGLKLQKNRFPKLEFDLQQEILNHKPQPQPNFTKNIKFPSNPVDVR